MFTVKNSTVILCLLTTRTWNLYLVIFLVDMMDLFSLCGLQTAWPSLEGHN